MIALGLGCVGSGPLVLALQISLDMGPTPTRKQQIALYEIIACLVLAGLWAACSLLIRHWNAIEASIAGQAPGETRALLLCGVLQRLSIVGQNMRTMSLCSEQATALSVEHVVS